MKLKYGTGCEAGIDEVGKGCLFGPVFVACVVLPDDFDFSGIKDSKLITSRSTRESTAERIKKEALAYSIKFESSKLIDQLNILEATFVAMHKAADDVVKQLNGVEPLLLVDGKFFAKHKTLDHVCIIKGDNTIASIACASILAKVARDEYIRDACIACPELNEKYKLLKNKGYPAKVHVEGIAKYGLAEEHRRSFNICKQAAEESL